MPPELDEGLGSGRKWGILASFSRQEWIFSQEAEDVDRDKAVR